jgi:23S rRNA pseudouridine1911/1915/1917 synthase
VVAPSSLGAKRAELQIDKVVGNTVFVEIKTGRYHQIRAQLAAAGAPVQGDEKYGAKPSKKPGIALCHCEMELPHPIGGEILTLHLL